MKILYLTSYTDISFGGDSRVSWELARYAARNSNNEVWMLSPDKKFEIKKDILEKKLNVYTYPGEEIAYDFKMLKMTPLNLKEIFDFLDKLNPDVIHCHFTTPIAFISQSWALKNNKPFLYTGHTLPSAVMGYQESKWLGKLMSVITIGFDSYIKFFLEGCTSIVTLNKYIQDDVERFIKKDIRTDIIPNGRDFSNYALTRAKMSDEYINCIFTGHISKRKNQEYLVKSLIHLKTDRKVRLYLVGSVMDEDSDKAIHKDMLNLPKNVEVILTGFMDHKELSKLYSKSHFMLSASKLEVQSLVILEGLISGIPVIALPNETTKEIIKDGLNGYLCKKNCSNEEFANILSKFTRMSDKEYLELKNSTRKSVEHFNWASVLEKTEKLYSELIESKKNTTISHDDLTGIERVSSVFKLDRGKEFIDKNRNTPLLAFISVFMLGFLVIYRIFSFLSRNKKE